MKSFINKFNTISVEQLRAVNRADLTDYVGFVDDEATWRQINNGIKKTFGLWIYKNGRSGDIRCLCPKCLQDYKANPSIIVKRLDPFARSKDRCIKCDNPGYDYLLFDRRQNH